MIEAVCTLVICTVITYQNNCNILIKEFIYVPWLIKICYYVSKEPLGVIFH